MYHHQTLPVVFQYFMEDTSQNFIIFTSLLWTVSEWSSSYLEVSKNGPSNSVRFYNSWPEYKDYFCITDCLPFYKSHHEACLSHSNMIYVQFVIHTSPKTNSEKLILNNSPVLYLVTWYTCFLVALDFSSVFSRPYLQFVKIILSTNPVFQHPCSPSSFISPENTTSIHFP